MAVAAKIGMVTASRFLTRASQLFSFVLLARVLSPQGFGDYGILTSAVFLVALIGNLGLRQSAAWALGRQQLEPGQVASTILLAWPFLSAGCCAALWWLNQKEFGALSLSETISLYVSIFAIMAITLLQGVFLGRGRTSSFALVDSGPRVLQSALVVLLWALGWLNTATAMLSFAAGFLLFVPVALSQVYKGTTARRPVLRALPRLIQHGILFALSLFLIMLQSRVGLFFLKGADGAHAAGQFFAAQRASEIVLDVATAAALVLFSETARSTDPAAALKMAMRAATGLFLTFTTVGIGIAAAAPYAVQIVLGSAYADARDALVVLGLGLGPVAAARIMNSVVSGMGRPWLSALVAVAGVGVNLACCYLLVPMWGATGASLALVIGQSTTCIVYVLVCKFAFGLRLRESVPDFRAAGRKLVAKLRRKRQSPN